MGRVTRKYLLLIATNSSASFGRSSPVFSIHATIYLLATVGVGDRSIFPPLPTNAGRRRIVVH